MTRFTNHLKIFLVCCFLGSTVIVKNASAQILPGVFESCPVTEEPLPTEFSIQQRWESPDVDGRRVLAYQTPIVGDLFGNGQPVVVVSADNDYTPGATVAGRRAQDLHLFNGADGSYISTIDTPFFMSWSGHASAAIADVNGDGQGEIIVKANTANGAGTTYDRRLVAYEYAGSDVWNEMWVSNELYDYGEGRGRAGGALGIADFNGDGEPEVYVGDQIFNAQTGERLAALASGASSGCPYPGTWGCFVLQSTAVNMDSDDELELVAGNVVYDVIINSTSDETLNEINIIEEADPSVGGVGDGFTAVADMDLDGTPDVVVVRTSNSAQSGLTTIYVWEGQSDEVMAMRTGDIGNGGGSPMIGDIDGDGAPEIVIANVGALRAFDFESGTGLVEKWMLPTGDGSGITSLSMFDFNQDQQMELVYRDEDNIRIINGSGAGAEDLASFGCTSGTATEMPVIASLDDTGEARILATCGTVAPLQRGVVRAFETASFPWADTRPVWNQQAYFVAHINNDLTVPSNQFQHWQSFEDTAMRCSDGTNRPLNAFQQQVTNLDENSGCPTVCEPVDFGDAPESYGTLNADDGARHEVADYDETDNTASLMLGATIDFELEGQPGADADGDDLNGGATDDEDAFDGVIGLQPGATTLSLDVPVTNTTGSDAVLYAWIDADNDGMFQPNEFTSATVPDGATTATVDWTGLTPLTDGTQPVLRFRLTTDALTDDTATPADERAGGLATDGEVEDHPGLVATPFPISCTDPFIEDFGAGTGFGPELPSGQTTYQYVGATPADGTIDANQYAIVPSPFDAHNAFHDDADHTPGDTDGRMMVVNADFTTGIFFRRTYSGLASGGTYFFSAWLSNVVNANTPDLPNVTFRVVDPATGDVLDMASVDSGNLPNTTSMEWDRFDLQFTAPQSTVRLELVDNTPGSAGNDLAIDDITFAQVCEFGDAPDIYGTTLANNGPGHVAGGPMLGTARDTEEDGQPTDDADGDDANGDTPDDEDGVTDPIVLVAGEPTTVEVMVTNNTDEPATLAGWIDNPNGTFDDDAPVTAAIDPNFVGSVPLEFPAVTTSSDASFARFRVFSGNVTDPQPTGSVAAGEVEDYPVTLLQNINIELNGGSCWRMLSSPVQGITYADMLENIWTQGAEGSNFPGSTEPNVFTWDIDTWTPVSNLNTVIPPGVGFLVSVFNLDDFEDPDSDIWPKTLTLPAGPEHTAPLAAPVGSAATDEWILLGNPFQSNINTVELDNNSANLSGAYYVYDRNYPDGNGPGNWRSTADGFGELVDAAIAAGQGFFVQAGGDSPSLDFTDPAKTTGGEFYGKLAERKDYVRLEIEGEEISNALWIRFSQAGSKERTWGDAIKLNPLSEKYALLGARKAGGTLMDIAHYPLGEQDLEIPVSAEATEPGTYTLSATEMDLPAGMDLYLYDRQTGESVLIDEQLEYSFTVGQVAKIPEPDTGGIVSCSATPERAKTSGTDRFVISSSPGVPPSERPEEVGLDQNYPNPFNPSTQITYQLPAASEVRLEVFDMLGRRVATLVEGTAEAGVHQVNFDASHLSSGVYLYTLQAEGVALTRKLTLIK